MLLTFLFPGVPLRWVFQMVALALLTVGIWLLTRYVTKIFIYCIDEAGDLTVTEANTKGKRRVTVCRVAVAGVRRRTVIRSDEELKRLRKKLRSEGKRYFDYVTDYRPSESILIEVNEGNERFGIRLSYDERLYAMLVPKEEQEEGSES